VSDSLSILLSKRDGRRKVVNQLLLGALFLAALSAVAPLVNIFIFVIRKGAPALTWEFLTSLPQPVGETGGGMGNAILGTIILVSLASAIGVPLGVAAGVYMAEYSYSKLSRWLRFGVDLLTSVPSIIVGLFAYAMVVLPMKRFSAHAGGFALAVIMIPTVARTTEELLKLVPTHLREAGLALGIPRWKVTLQVTLRTAWGGIMTGIMLALARAAGETAPLLITALNNKFWPRSLDQPISSVPVQIYTYAISPFEEWHQQAWAGAFLLVALVFALNLTTRLLMGRTPVSKD
jgi:phosphate transport system permease protein